MSALADAGETLNEAHYALQNVSHCSTDSKILRTFPIFGNCEEQTDAQVKRNIERFTEMAKNYGWRWD